MINIKHSIGSTWLFGIVMTFTLIFAGFLVISINYTRAYKIKNEMINIIEKYEGLSLKTTGDNENTKNWGSINVINNYLKTSGYSAKHACTNTKFNDEVYAESSLEKNIKPVKFNYSNWKKDKYYYCIYDESKNNEHKYTVEIFFDINLPVFGKIGTYSVKGSTDYIYAQNTI